LWPVTGAAAAPPAEEKTAPLPDLEDDQELAEVYHLVLWNDDVSPFGLVVRMLVEVLGYTPAKALEKTRSVEINGKGIIFTGTLELCELRHEQFGEVKLTTTIEEA